MKNKKFKVTNIYFHALGTVQLKSAGEIVIVSGLGDAKIGDSIVSPEDVNPLEKLPSIHQQCLLRFQ